MIDKNLRSILLSDTAITNLIATNAVYPIKLPQEVAKPCIVYNVFNGIPELTYNGVSNLMRYTVDITIYSESYGNMRELARKVIARLNGYSSNSYADTQIRGVKVHSTFNDFEEKLQLCTTTIDLTIYVKEQ